jgi:1-acyl-sn-glycerol-3-phosphate acyltransferase
VTVLTALRRRLAAGVVGGIAWALPSIVRRALRRGLHGVWARGDWGALAQGGVLVANHHSWWDLYLIFLIKLHLGLPLSAIMARAQLDRFPFFRRHGALDETEVRTALRRLKAGEVLLVFPEGELRPAGGLGPIRPGARWLAERAGVPLIPLALRVLMRGAQHPEAYLSVGPPLAHDPDGDGGEGALSALLLQLDRDLAGGDPERPHPAFERWLAGAQRGDRRADRASAWWRA